MPQAALARGIATATDGAGATQRAIMIAQRARECLGNAREVHARLTPPSPKIRPEGSAPVPPPDHIVFAQEDTDRTLVELNDTLLRIGGLL